MRGRGGTSRGGKPRVLVDTTFLLPALGIGVEREALDAIRLFRRLEVYYLEAGLLEAMWKTLKLVPPEKIARVEMGIVAIRKTYKLLTPQPEAFTLAFRIYHAGHHDYIDALHYASAKTSGIPFLTIDAGLIEFLRAKGFQVDGIVYTPGDLQGLLGGPV